MYVLGIETSCDETACAIVESVGQEVKILSQQISSQIDLHKAYGGVIPELASREHLKNLPVILDSVLKTAQLKLEQIDGIGVTSGPGLKGSLLMGINFARGLSLAKNIPLIGINHIEGHILAPMLEHPDLDFPFIALIVSGGHTEIHLAKGLGDYQLIARTIDDAAGEAFDKSAHLLGFEYPGGPKLAQVADSVNSTNFKLPKVMRESPDFSFSGLKTAIALLIQKQKTELGDPKIFGSLCYAIQEAIVEALLYKLDKALKFTNVNKVVVSGGVSANKYLRKKIAEIKNVQCYFPQMQHCMDNAAMIALVAAKRFAHNKKLSDDLKVRARWPVETLNSNFTL